MAQCMLAVALSSELSIHGRSYTQNLYNSSAGRQRQEGPWSSQDSQHSPISELQVLKKRAAKEDTQCRPLVSTPAHTQFMIAFFLGGGYIDILCTSQSYPGVLVRIIIAVMKYYNQKHLRQKQVYLSYTSLLLFIIKGSQTRPRTGQGPGGRS